MFVKHHAFQATVLLLGLSLGLMACEKAPDSTAADAPAAASVPATINVLDELKTEPSRVFAATPNDAQDIAALLQFQQNFAAQSEQMELELEKKQQQGLLKVPEALARKMTNLQNGLQQLSTLELQTEQGRYIQGLWQQYWQNQQQVLQQQSQAQSGNAQANLSAANLGNSAGLKTYLQAQQQLRDWQEQQK